MEHSTSTTAARISNRLRSNALPRSLLVVDDDQLALTLVAERLKSAGYAVTTAHDALQACELLQTQTFPVVVTDYRMPRMDGAQLVKRVRERNGQDSYCIMWTMCSDDEDRARSFEFGVDDHLSKRINDRELLARIEAGFETIELRQSLRRTRDVFEQTGAFSRYQPGSNDTNLDGWNTVASHLHAEMAFAAREHLSVSILMLHVERSLASSAQVKDQVKTQVKTQTKTQTKAQAIVKNRAATPLSSKAAAKANELVNTLVHTVHSQVRLGVDIVLPLDVQSGLARVLVVLPGASAVDVERVLERVGKAIAESLLIDEFAELQPECAVGIATFDGSAEADSGVMNAAELVAMAENRMESLAQC